MIAAELAELLGGDLGVSSIDDLTESIAANVAGLRCGHRCGVAQCP